MSSQDEQIAATARQPRGARAARRRRSTRAGSSAAHTVAELVAAHGERVARRARSRAAGDRHQRPHPRHPLVRQGELPGRLRRPAEDPDLHPPGRAAAARLPDLQAARFRRLDRRRGPAVPHEDQRADDLGVAAALPREVPAAAAREVARADRRRDPLPPALSRSDRQPRLAPGLRDRAAASSRRFASS